MMTSNAPSKTMQTIGTVLSWLVGYAVVVLLIIIGAFIRSNSGTGNRGHGLLEEFVNRVGPLLGLSVLAAAAVAVALCIVGIARWPAQIIRSPQWVFSAIGIVLDQQGPQHVGQGFAVGAAVAVDGGSEQARQRVALDALGQFGVGESQRLAQGLGQGRVASGLAGRFSGVGVRAERFSAGPLAHR